MKAKTISAILSGKFNKFLKSIDNEVTRELIKNNSIITGGAIASFLLNEEVNDYDIYFTNKETALAAANYFVDKFNSNKNSANSGDNKIEIPLAAVKEGEDRISIVVKSAGVASAVSEDTITDGGSYNYFEGDPNASANYAREYVEKLNTHSEYAKDKFVGQFRPVFLSSNAITLSDQMQLVFRFFGDAKTIHENYDFIHCKNYWESATQTLHLNADALESLMTKELVYIGSKYPICSIIRLRKFLARGFTINAGNILKMCMQVSELDLTDVAVLQEQLVGVDSAYFREIISKLSTKTVDGKVDNAYLFELIDKVF